ncbi:MAG TPA: hypothetical protein VHB02_18425 [Acidimicrobiales bacterium]|nr:hypothetical protein [Acidimicrobiales bacterium]
MIAKIGRGKDIGRLIRYLFSPGRHNEHTNPRVIAAADSLDPNCGVPLTWDEVGELGRACDAPRIDFGVEVTGGHVWHLSLSNHKDDRPPTDEEWAEVARASMAAMGFSEGEGRASCRWVAVAHGTSSAGNEHIHIAVSLVREDGRVASVWQERVTMSKVCAELEQTYGLTATHAGRGAGLPGVTRAEEERAGREGRAEPDRIGLARRVRSASVASETEAEFVRRLRRAGVLVRPRFAPGGREEVVGYSVALRPTEGAEPIWFGGGRLARDLALPRLRELWEASPSDPVAVAEWRSTRLTQEGREVQVGSPESWRFAAEAVHDAYEHLAAVPIDDAATWAGAARDLAGAFAASSFRLEGSTPGPLAKAAHLLARSAQTAAKERASLRHPARNLRGVAIIVQQARYGENNEKEWAALLTQMRGTALLLARLHAERGERFQATRLARLADGELARLCERLDRRVVPTPGRRVPEVAPRIPAVGTSPAASPSARESER